MARGRIINRINEFKNDFVYLLIIAKLRHNIDVFIKKKMKLLQDISSTVCFYYVFLIVSPFSSLLESSTFDLIIPSSKNTMR